MNRIAPICAGAVLLLAPGAVAALADEKPYFLGDPSEKILAQYNLASMNKLGGLAVSGTPSKLGGFLYAFDRRPETAYETKDFGDAHLLFEFAKPIDVRSIRILLPAEGEKWSLESADSAVELEGRRGSFKELIPARPCHAAGIWDQVTMPKGTSVRCVRLNVQAAGAGKSSRILDFSVWGEQAIEGIAVRAPRPEIPLNDYIELSLTGYLSGGELVPITGKGLKWTLSPDTTARMIGFNRISGRRRGDVQVTVRFGSMVSPPLTLSVD